MTTDSQFHCKPLCWLYSSYDQYPTDFPKDFWISLTLWGIKRLIGNTQSSKLPNDFKYSQSHLPNSWVFFISGLCILDCLFSGFLHILSKVQFVSFFCCAFRPSTQLNMIRYPIIPIVWFSLCHLDWNSPILSNEFLILSCAQFLHCETTLTPSPCQIHSRIPCSCSRTDQPYTHLPIITSSTFCDTSHLHLV